MVVLFESAFVVTPPALLILLGRGKGGFLLNCVGVGDCDIDDDIIGDSVGCGFDNDDTNGIGFCNRSTSDDKDMDFVCMLFRFGAAAAVIGCGGGRGGCDDCVATPSTLSNNPCCSSCNVKS